MTSKFFTTVAAATTLAGIVTTAGTANAASLSYTASIASQQTDILNAPLSVQQFNSSLGTLNSVELDFISNITGNASVTNTGTTNGKFSLSLGAEVDLVDTVSNQGLLSLNPFTSSSLLSVGAKNSLSTPTLTASDSTSEILTTGSLFQSFIGNGNRNFLFSALAQSGVIGSGNVTSVVNTFADGTLTVIYNYTEGSQPVPEPSALLGIGLAGVGILLQTKKNRLKMSNS